MLTLDSLRTERRNEIMRLAARRGAQSVRVFGSVARGESNESSDLDLLVSWRRAGAFSTTLDSFRIFRSCSA